MLRFLIALLLTCSPVSVYATSTIEIEFLFTPPDGQTISSYKLMREGVLDCTIPLADVVGSSFDCDTEAAHDSPYSWTLIAVYDDATESPASPSYIFTLSSENKASQAGEVTTPSGQICLPYNLSGVTNETDWSHDIVDTVDSRFAITALLNGTDQQTAWDNPQSRQLCWAGTFPIFGVVSVRLSTYRGSKWTAETAYSQGDEVTGALDDFYYTVTAAGTTGTTEPVWPTTVDAVISDGTVQFQAKDNANNWTGHKQMRLVYLKQGEVLKKSSTYRTGGSFGVRAR